MRGKYVGHKWQPRDFLCLSISFVLVTSAFKGLAPSEVREVERSRMLVTKTQGGPRGEKAGWVRGAPKLTLTFYSTSFLLCI